MPSYTHLRRAQPVLVAHYFLSHAAALRRDHARLAVAADEADALTLGIGCRRGHELRRGHVFPRAGRSGFPVSFATASTPRPIATSWPLSCMPASMTMVHLSRLAEDLIIFTGEEHGFFDLSDASATGSSMMPQKKNPDPLELVRGKSGRTIGRLTGWLATMKGLPSGYNKDLQEDKEAVFDAEATLSASIRATHAVVSRLALNADRTDATRRRDCCWPPTSPTISWRAVCRSGRRTKSWVGWSGACSPKGGLQYAHPRGMAGRESIVRQRRAAGISALASVEARRTPQSTNPAAVRASLEECRQWLENATSQPYAAAQGHGPGRQE